MKQNDHEIIRKACGISSGSPMVKPSERIQRVAQTLMDIHMVKKSEYGDYLPQRMDEPWPFNFMLQFCDSKRKWCRFENLAKEICAGGKAKERLIRLSIATLADLGVYCLMGIELLLTIYEEDNLKDEVL